MKDFFHLSKWKLPIIENYWMIQYFSIFVKLIIFIINFIFVFHFKFHLSSFETGNLHQQLFNQLQKNPFETAVWLNHPFTNTTWKTSFAHHQAKEQEESYSLISQRCKQVNTRQDVQNFLKNLDQPNAISLSTTQALKPKTYTSPALGLVVDGQSVLSNVSVLNSI